MSLCILYLYLPADTPPDVDAAKAVVSGLCRDATIAELRVLLTKMWITSEHPVTGDRRTDAMIFDRADVLRAAAESALHRLLDTFAASLRGPHVVRFRLDTGTGGGVDVYRDRLTDESHPWHIVCGHRRFPPGWTVRIGAACGLLDPRGSGPAVTMVTFRAWAAPGDATRHTCALTPTDEGGDLDFVAHYGAPGVGEQWRCVQCRRSWALVGDVFYDPADGAHILSLDDVI